MFNCGQFANKSYIYPVPGDAISIGHLKVIFNISPSDVQRDFTRIITEMGTLAAAPNVGGYELRQR
jgi:hypothetical protein